MAKRNIMIRLRPVDRSFIERFSGVVLFIEATILVIKENRYVKNRIIEAIGKIKGDR